MPPELEKEFDEITTGRDRMCDEFTRKDVKSFIDTNFIARSEVVKMIEGLKVTTYTEEDFDKGIILQEFIDEKVKKVLLESLSTLKKRI